MISCLCLCGEYVVFWIIDRICKYYVDRDYDKRYQIWRSEFEILFLVTCFWCVWFQRVPWVFLAFTFLTWLASVPNEGQKILFKGKLFLIVPVMKKAFMNTMRHYENIRAGIPGASENASLIEKTIFSIFIAFSTIRRTADVRRRVRSSIDNVRGLWRDTVENYRNMELQTPNQSFAATQKSVSFEASPTVYTFSPPQMSSTPINNYSNNIGNGSTPHSHNLSVGRRVSLRRQAKSNHSAVKTS